MGGRQAESLTYDSLPRFTLRRADHAIDRLVEYLAARILIADDSLGVERVVNAPVQVARNDKMERSASLAHIAYCVLAESLRDCREYTFENRQGPHWKGPTAG